MPRGTFGAYLVNIIMVETNKNAGSTVLEQIPVDMISLPEYLPPSFWDTDFSTLTEDTKKVGVIQGQLVVRRGKGSTYEVVEGSRSFKAFANAFPNKLVWVRVERLHDKDAVSAVFNDLSVDNVIEQAEYIEQLCKQFNWTQKEVGEALELRRSTVAHRLRLLKLHHRVVEFIKRGRLSGVCGKYLCTLKSKRQQLALAKKTIENNWSSHRLYKELNPEFSSKSNIIQLNPSNESKPKNISGVRDIYTESMENKLSEKLGSKVEINANKYTEHHGTLDFKIHDVNSIIAIGDGFYRADLRKPHLIKGLLSIELNNLDHLNEIIEEVIGIDQHT